jgi:uncharacterized protein (TIGR02271 family)
MFRRTLRALLGVGSSSADDPAVLPSPSAPASPRSSAVTAPYTPETNQNLVVVGENGEPYSLLQRSNDNGIDTLLLGRGDGSQISLPFTDLTWKGAGTWMLPDAVRDARGLVIPVVEERLEVARERVETGRVRISKSVEAREVVVDDPLKRETVRVEHVPINQVVTGEVPQVREEGDVTVIPILEERVVTRTELVLVEEVRIHRDYSQYHDPQRVTLRKEVVAVERFGEDGKLLPS